MLSMKIPIILCLRAKEKIKIVGGKPVELGWQPIVGERLAFETMFTLMLPPHAKGLPDLALSDMRDPFDQMVPPDRPLDEALGRALAAWAAGGVTGRETHHDGAPPPVVTSTGDVSPDRARSLLLDAIEEATQTLLRRNTSSQKAIDRVRHQHLAQDDELTAPLSALESLRNNLTAMAG